MNFIWLAHGPVLICGGARTQIQVLRAFNGLLSNCRVRSMKKHPKRLSDLEKMVKLVNGHSMTMIQSFASISLPSSK